tara:strand:- start:335 stop:562 length:228 start_codon:yes stop_codon:yes gene_type:complete
MSFKTKGRYAAKEKKMSILNDKTISDNTKFMFNNFLLAIKTIMNNEKKNVNICEILTKDSTTLIAFIIDKKAKIT